MTNYVDKSQFSPHLAAVKRDFSPIRRFDNMAEGLSVVQI
jgi:hypothetical protein